MLLSDEEDEKSAWHGNGQHANGFHIAKGNGENSESLLSEEARHKRGATDATAPPASVHSSGGFLSSVPSAHRPFLFLLCFVSFFVTFRPSEPFLTPYLIDDKGLGADAVNERVYPTWTYCYFAFLLPAGVLGEVVGSRAMIVAQLSSLLATYVILIWAEGVAWMQFMQATYGFASAVQSCIFFTFVYRCTPVELYPIVTAYQRASGLTGHCQLAHTLSSPRPSSPAPEPLPAAHRPDIQLCAWFRTVIGALVGQVLVWTSYPLWQLFLPTLTAVAVALAAFLFLPSQQSQRALVDTEVAVQPAKAVDGALTLHAPPSAPSVAPGVLFASLRSVLSGNLSPLSQLLALVASQYRNPTVRTFSVYLMLGYSVQELVLNYDTTLFYEIKPSASLNGIVVGAGWLIGALAAYLVSVHGVVHSVRRHPHLTLSLLPLTASALLLWSSAAESVELAYSLFVAFYGIMAFLVCVSSALIASHMSVGTFSLLFSVNTFGSLLVQTLVQILIGDRVLLLDIRGKYRWFAAQLFFVAVLFALVGVKRRLEKGAK